MVLTYGLLVIAVNIAYLIFSVLSGVGFYCLFRRKWWVGVSGFLVILILPFYDLIIQKSIKTYYETFKMSDTIYAYPEKDANGKIESLATYQSDSKSNSVFYYKNSYRDFLNVFSNVDDFVEVKIRLDFDSNTGKYIDVYGEKLVRINLKDESYMDIASKDLEARYVVESNEFESMFFGIYHKKIFLFKDATRQEVLARAWKIEFPKNKDSFRNKFLFWRNANGVPIGIDYISNDKAISEKVFGSDYKLNISKLRG